VTGRTRLGVAVTALLLSAACASSGSDIAPGASVMPPPTAAALDCPPEFVGGAHTSQGLSEQEPWVPHQPTVDTGGRLTPSTTPDSVVVCAYGANEPRDPARTVLHGDLSTVTADLSKLGGDARTSFPCLAYLALTDFQNFLIGLHFDSGVVWVSAMGNHCSGSSNGVDLSRSNLRADAQAAYRMGYWNTDPAAVAGCDAVSNRGPGDTPVVPDDPTGVTICLARFNAPGWRAFT